VTSFPPLPPTTKATEDAPRGASSRYVLPETTLLMVLGLLDMLSTIYLLATGQAHEANPLFDGILHTFGPIGFILFKALLLGGPLALAEWARRHNEPFVRSALRLGILLYIGFYLINVARLNLHYLLQ
jgi:uncharacterized membrane protein